MKTKAMTSILALAVVTVTVALAQERFDMLVRQAFFAGFNGNREALERGMKITEDTLAKDPNHAEARVWHGSGVLYLSGQAFQKGDQQNGMKLWRQGLDEMEQAVRLAPNNVAVLIPRGATLITILERLCRRQHDLGIGAEVGSGTVHPYSSRHASECELYRRNEFLVRRRHGGPPQRRKAYGAAGCARPRPRVAVPPGFLERLRPRAPPSESVLIRRRLC